MGNVTIFDLPTFFMIMTDSQLHKVQESITLYFICNLNPNHKELHKRSFMKRIRKIC